MVSHAPFGSSTPKIILWGLVAFTLLTFRFSPNWLTFLQGVREVAPEVSSSPIRSKGILSGYSVRGYYVAQQAENLTADIADANHRIVRWRLLMPTLGHLFQLPPWKLLSLAHVGCLVLIIVLVALGSVRVGTTDAAGANPIFLGLIAGASAPFFTSMGLLGYYDSWLALALLGVAFARSRTVVILACVLGPWIDERFVIALPLSLYVRWILVGRPVQSGFVWLRQQALYPVALTAIYAAVRLSLGGGSSHTVSEYLEQFIFGREVHFFNYLFGAWSGLRVGWVLVVGAVMALWASGQPRVRRQGVILGAGIGLTALAGLWTAMDLSRSMILVLPVVPLGWILTARVPHWRVHSIAPALAAAALLLPAHHVVNASARLVDSTWSTCTPLADAQTGMGMIYSEGAGVTKDSTKAAELFRQAAHDGYAAGQSNLAVMYNTGEGVEEDPDQAVFWFVKAAEQGFAAAQFNLGLMYEKADGIPGNFEKAAAWYREAAEQGFVHAQNNLAYLYLNGKGMRKDTVEAAKWYRRAANQGLPLAQSNLGVLYARGEGVPRDVAQGLAWLIIAARQGSAEATKNLAMVERDMDENQKTRARALVQKLLAKLPR